MVWIAGPLSGLIVQPVIGVISDENTSKWGRRRPMMVLGAAIVAVAMLVLGFTKELVGYFIADSDAARIPTIFLAVFSIYVVDFAINAGKIGFPLCREHRWLTASSESHVLLAKSNCRYASHRKAAVWRCMG